VTLTVVAVAATAGTWAVGAPVLGHGWQPVAAAPWAAAATLAWVLRWRSPGRGTGRAPRRALVAGALAAAVFAVGTFNTLVIDGRVVAATSAEARTYQLTVELVDHRLEFVDVDELLALPLSEIRPRFRELEPAQRRMESINARWAAVSLESLPDAELAPIVTEARLAAYHAGLALERKRTLMAINDAHAAAELDAFRAQFVTHALAMDPRLVAIVDRFGFPIDAFDQETR
jgi:hypothetical protein